MNKLFGKKIVAALLMICFLIVGTVTPVEAKNSDSAGQAAVLTLDGGWTDGKTASQGELQYFKVVLPSAGKLRIEIRPKFDVECSFLNSDFTKTYFNTTYKKNYYVSLDAGEYEAVDSNFEAGTYYYTVKGISTYGDFSMKAVFEPANNNENEPNQSFDQAMELTQGSIKGFISEDDAVDYYVVHLTDHQSFVLKPMGYDSQIFSILDNLSIYDSSRQLIYQTTWGIDKPVEFQWPAGAYYIKVEQDKDSLKPQGAYGFEYLVVDNAQDKVQYTYFDKRYQTMYMNSSVTIKPVVLPASASNKKFQWKSSNTKIATVTSTGKVTGIKPGAVVITATSVDNPSSSISYNLTVQSVILTLEKSNVNMKVGKKYTVKTKYLYGASQTITYSSLNSKIATVNKKGVVTAKKAGTTKIKVQANGLTRYVTIKIKK